VQIVQVMEWYVSPSLSARRIRRPGNILQYLPRHSWQLGNVHRVSVRLISGLSDRSTVVPFALFIPAFSIFLCSLAVLFCSFAIFLFSFFIFLASFVFSLPICALLWLMRLSHLNTVGGLYPAAGFFEGWDVTCPVQAMRGSPIA
jgi:hypothetical protein